MRILVTGGAGFIGSHLVEKLLADGHDVAILDDFNDFYDPRIKRDNISTVEKEITVHDVDLRDGDKVASLFGKEKFDVIAHLAARAGVRPSIQQPQLYYDTNVAGTLHLLEAARTNGVGRFIFASSSSVYGAAKKVPFSEEEHLTQTLSPYAATKSVVNFSARLTRISTKFESSRCAISPFTGRDNVPISRSISSRKKFMRTNRSISSVTARRAATTPTSTTSSKGRRRRSNTTGPCSTFLISARVKRFSSKT